MKNEFIHYIKRRVVTEFPKDPNSPWFKELDHYNNFFDRPSFHITRSQSYPVCEICIGDRIWLVSQLTSPWGSLPPSLDAVIEVGKIKIKKNKIVFIATDNSRWFTLTDASKMLQNVGVVLKSGIETHLFNIERNNLGQAFQSMKKLSNPQIIDNWTRDTKNFDFVSYRIIDGTKASFFFIKKLMKEKKSIFWDRWSLPRRLAERRELVSDIKLDEYLVKKIIEAQVVWGIESTCYNEKGSYSAKEKSIAKKLNKFKKVEN